MQRVSLKACFGQYGFSRQRIGIFLQQQMQFAKILFQDHGGFGVVVPIDNGSNEFFRLSIVLQEFRHGGFVQQDIGQADMRHFDFTFQCNAA